jgi:hypothetical protein
LDVKNIFAGSLLEMLLELIVKNWRPGKKIVQNLANFGHFSMKNASFSPNFDLKNSM